MKGNVLEAITGAVFLTIALFFLYFAYTTNGGNIDGYILKALFEDVGGLSIGSDIKMNGIKIGFVKSLNIDSTYQAAVELLIKKEVKIPIDSAANITTEGIMGNKFIAIVPGVEQRFFLQGDEIEMTKSAVNLEKLVDKLLVK
ncbi:MAG: MlaD family protein [Holosporales bacterium]|jgi:phospholipid/cholesterol/gamma-HCH transport system substrate-binding protein|nr:MlaD family protein [Holosporales bacterium]